MHPTGPHGTPPATLTSQLQEPTLAHPRPPPFEHPPYPMRPFPHNLWGPCLTPHGTPASHPMGPLPNTADVARGTSPPHRGRRPVAPHPRTSWDPTLAPRGTPAVHPTAPHSHTARTPREPTLAPRGTRPSHLADVVMTSPHGTPPLHHRGTLWDPILAPRETPLVHPTGPHPCTLQGSTHAPQNPTLTLAVGPTLGPHHRP